jgi:hypothetical protein
MAMIEKQDETRSLASPKSLNRALTKCPKSSPRLPLSKVQMARHHISTDLQLDTQKPLHPTSSTPSPVKRYPTWHLHIVSRRLLRPPHDLHRSLAMGQTALGDPFTSSSPASRSPSRQKSPTVVQAEQHPARRLRTVSLRTHKHT